jgi:hypothetical protein
MNNNPLSESFDFLSKMPKVNHQRKYTAFMVEPRQHKAMSFVLSNFLKNLSDEWQLIVTVGDDNENYVRNIVQELGDNRILVFNIKLKNMNGIQYSKLLANSDLYKLIPTETFLIFQTDSIILEKDLLDKFIQYDYVGAPWIGTKQVGNGGLSLRKKSKMLRIIEQKGECYQNEDLYFALTNDLNKPDFELAKQFSIETAYNDISFGVHNCWMHLSKEDYAKLSSKYPQLEELRKLNPK